MSSRERAMKRAAAQARDAALTDDERALAVQRIVQGRGGECARASAPDAERRELPGGASIRLVALPALNAAPSDKRDHAPSTPRAVFADRCLGPSKPRSAWPE